MPDATIPGACACSHCQPDPLRAAIVGWNDDELLARQVVKLAEELGELADLVVMDDPQLDSFFGALVTIRDDAKKLFDNPAHFVGAECLDTQRAISELTDCQVAIHVAAHALHVPDVGYAAQVKALADEVRGVRKQGRVTGPDANGHYGFGCVLVPLEADDGK